MRTACVCLAFVLLRASLAPAQTTVFFDGEGPEEGITELGVSSFIFEGSNWALEGMGGRIVQTLPAERASGLQAFELISGDAGTDVVFDEPVDSIEFFYVHGGGLGSPGFVTVWGANFTVLGGMESRLATSFGDPANFIFFDPPEPIVRVNFNFGVVDNFTFTTVAPVPTVSAWGLTLMTLLLLAAATIAIRSVASACR